MCCVLWNPLLNMQNPSKVILLNSKLSWRTFYLIFIFLLGTKAQYVDNPYQSWNVPRPLPPYNPGPPQGSYNPYSPPNNPYLHLETFTEDPPFRGPPYNHPRDPGGRVFSTVHQYEVVNPVTPGTTSGPQKNTPFYGGIIDREIRMEKSKSPYIVREDVVIDRNGELIIEPGVVVKFAPMVGLTIRGILNIQVRVSRCWVYRGFFVNYLKRGKSVSVFIDILR